MQSAIATVIKSLPKTALVLGLATFFAAPDAAKAAFFHIDNTSPPNIAVSLNDFEGGFVINGNLVQQGLGSPANVNLVESPVPFTFSGSWIDVGQTTVGLTSTIWFTDAGNPGLLSDVLTFTYSRSGSFGSIVGTFVSYAVSQPIPGIVPGNLTVRSEAAGIFNFGNAFITASVDVTPVPEPSTYLAGGLLLLPLAFGALRRVRKNRTA